MQDTLAQEFEAASAIHLPFQKFQAMHLALRLAVASLQGEASFHRIVIFFQPRSKALKLWDAFFFHPIEPLIQALALSLPQHGREFLDQLVSLGNLRIFFAELSQVVLLPLQALLFLKSRPNRDLASRGRPFFLDFLRLDHRSKLWFDGLLRCEPGLFSLAKELQSGLQRSPSRCILAL